MLEEPFSPKAWPLPKPTVTCFPETSLWLAPTWPPVTLLLGRSHPPRPYLDMWNFGSNLNNGERDHIHSSRHWECTTAVRMQHCFTFVTSTVEPLNLFPSIFALSHYFSLHLVCPLGPVVQRHPVLLNWSAPLRNWWRARWWDRCYKQNSFYKCYKLRSLIYVQAHTLLLFI